MSPFTQRDSPGQVILATGYVRSWPFIAKYHEDTVQEDIPGQAPIVNKDGSGLRSLYLGVFYIDDPTLVIMAGALTWITSSQYYIVLIHFAPWKYSASVELRTLLCCCGC